MAETNKEKLSTLGIKVNQYTLERFNELKEDGAFDTSGQFLETLLERFSNPLKINKENEALVKSQAASLEQIKADLTTANSNCEAQVKEINRLKDINVGATVQVRIPALGEQTYSCIVRKVQAMASYATWRATKTNGQYDVKSFDVKVVPIERIEGLKPGMTAILEK